MLKYSILSKNTKIILNYTIGVLLFAVLSLAIIHQVKEQGNLGLTLDQIQTQLSVEGFGVLASIILLMLVNWGLEAWKWQILVLPLEKISFFQSFCAILVGVSFGLNTPNRIGESGGRVLYLKNSHKLRGILLGGIGSLSQLIITLSFGMVGIFFFLEHFSLTGRWNFSTDAFHTRLLLGLGILTVIGTFFLYFHLGRFGQRMGKSKYLHRWAQVAKVMEQFSGKDLIKLLVLSILRYGIFSAQYLILLHLLGVEMIWWQGFFILSIIFLVMALVPTITIAELGIRGAVSLFFLGFLSPNRIGILAGTIGIWFINLIIPAILGSLVLLKVRVFRDK
ncbi:MAG: lysylphosphatidylglycerol synthase domain-containing protein [Chitinophagaceae bacterium]